MMRYLKVWMLLVLAVLTACGGGGNPGGTTSTSTTPTTSQPTIVVSLVDASGTVLVTNAISKSAVYYAKAVVTNASGAVVANQLVTFSTNYTIATLAGGTTDTTALTDTSGVAKVLISPLSLTTTSAGALTVAATVGSAAVTASLNFGTTAANLTLESITTSSTSIGALETSSVTVIGSVNGIASSGILVNFSASCGTFSPSSFTTVSGGIARSTYQSTSACASTTVTLTASAVGATTNVTKTISVASARATNILFASFAPSGGLMYASSAASGNKTSVVKFQVVDSNSNGLPNATVNFSLSTDAIAAGVTFASSSTQGLTTDSNGFVSVTVASGALPIPVTVTAKLASDSTVTASSLGLRVTTGAATQSSVYTSISATKLSIEAFNIDGVTTSIVMRTADRMGNPVPDGTTVNFVVSAGLITGSCILSNSACTVTYTSQGATPANGRVAVLAYLNGEEAFVDLNGDNVWQPNEIFYPVGLPYVDANENLGYDIGEQKIGSTANSDSCAYAQTVEAYPSVVSSCDNSAWNGNVLVRKQLVLVAATSQAAADFISRTVNALVVNVHDNNQTASSNNAMPTGTTISAAVTTTGVACAVTSTSPNVVFNSTVGTNVRLNLNGSPSCIATGTTIVVTVTSPNGVITAIPFVAP